jgi:hypothetical protein
MKQLESHLQKERAKSKLNPHLIKELTKVINRGTITLPEWRDSGRFIGVDDYMKDNADAILHVDCTDVVEYMGGGIIQVLKNGEYFIDAEIKSDKLPDMEEVLWHSVNEKLF